MEKENRKEILTKEIIEKDFKRVRQGTVLCLTLGSVRNKIKQQ